MENCLQILQQGLTELNICANEQKLDSLLAFIQLIEKWNKAYNLTAVRKPEDMARLHILDSLAVLPFVQGEQVADIGTGAGLPGIPLAIFLPNVEFTLVDSNSKKTRFVQQAILELKLQNIKVVHCRVEKFYSEIFFSTVIMRAFSGLQNTIQLTEHLMTEKGILLAMKGQKPNDELNKIVQPYSVLPLQVPGVEGERCLIRIQGANNHG